jgi:hypothetical protein
MATAHTREEVELERLGVLIDHLIAAKEAGERHAEHATHADAVAGLSDDELADLARDEFADPDSDDADDDDPDGTDIYDDDFEDEHS